MQLYSGMKFWLKNKSRPLSVCDITLENGALPCINGQHVDEIEGIDGIEPGVWAKALIVEWICVDLERLVLSWTTCNPCTQRTTSESMEEQRERLPDSCQHTQTTPLKPEMPLDTDVDQLLEIAHYMYDNPGNHTLGKTVHLLHVFILPNITFDKDLDGDNIQRAIQNQTRNLERLDKEFSDIATEREGHKTIMRVWRWEMCKRINQKQIKLADCGVNFLNELLDGLKDDLTHCYPEITAANQKVSMWKEKADNMDKKELTNVLDELESARKERATLLDNLNMVLVCREEIELYLAEKLVKPEPEELSENLLGYMRTVDCQKRLKETMYEINHKKICAISVREALIRAQEELKRFTRTPGLERSVTGTHFSSNILPEDNLPREWRTLQKRVFDAIEQNEELKKRKIRFEEEIAEICQSKQRRSRKPKSKEKKKVDDDEHYKKARQFRESLRSTLPREHYSGIAIHVNQKISDHFEGMTKALLSELRMKVYGGRVWLCYERCTFPTIFAPYIEKVYERAYSKELRILKDILVNITVEDLATRDDKYMLNLLKLYTPDDDQITVQSDSSLRTSTTGRIDQSDSSVESGVTIEDVQPVVVRRRDKSKSARTHRRITTIQDGLLCTPPRRSHSFCSEAIFFQDLDRLSPPEHSRGTVYQNYRPMNNNTLDSVDSGLYGEHGSLGQLLTNGKRNNVDTNHAFLNSTDSATATTSSESSSPAAVRKSRDVNNEEFLKLYQSPISSFMEVTAPSTSVPMKKYQWLYKCLSELTDIAQEQAKAIHCGRSIGFSGDEVLTALTFFLIQCDPERVVKAYAQIRFLQDYLPGFLSAGHFAFTLNQFLVAYSYIIEEKWKESKSSPIDIRS